ncbi:hypothetical protein K4H28_12095 [Deefgea tanakiae]|uniref:Uncharacterized protein n=1 Tax=Deefgea tanakiae TaxID=2865840 RepID=A0ABX8Z380_9NEIS|nr:hypothetical protein [Deefgea tanakiae]QZA77037.1 hypothetical protein K4H28_12095 [Deefgea tanakiae]
MIMIAPESLRTAYLEVTYQAILTSRSLANFALTSNDEAERLIALEQIRDLQDAIHVIVELINDWGRCNEESLRSSFLAAHDKKWSKKTQVYSIKLLDVLDEKLNTA